MQHRAGFTLRYGLVVMLAWFLASCSLVEQTPGAHPLAGSFYTPEGKVEEQDVLKRMSQADVVILAEKHDNTAHHALQLRLLKRLLEQGHHPALGMEMFSRDQTSLLMQYIEPVPHSRSVTEDTLRKAMSVNGADVQWQQYAPLLSELKAASSPAFGLDLPVALRVRLGTLGESGLLPTERELLPPAPEADAEYRALMFERIKASHCGWGPEPYLRRLIRIWELRNQTMARQISAMLRTGHRPILVIVGNGHTEYNLGLVSRLTHLDPDAKVLNLGMLETEPEKNRFTDYLFGNRLPGRPRYDMIYLAPAAPVNDDLCAAFHKRQREKP